MSVHRDLSKLLEANVISPEVAEKIEAYYKTQERRGQNRIFIAFGILGSVLVGLGIILIIGHNWDNLSRPVKTMFSIVPMIVSHGICGWTLWKRNDSVAWREIGAIFLFFSVGACIALIGQIYHLSGDFNSFMFTWMAVCFPIPYIMKSSMVSLFYIVGVVVYGCNLGYGSMFRTRETMMYFWILFIAILPYYYLLIRRSPNSNFTIFHHWIIPIALTVTVGTVVDSNEIFLPLVYLSLSSLFYAIGNHIFFKQNRFWYQGYGSLGAVGAIIILLLYTFDFLWDEMLHHQYNLYDFSSPEFITFSILTILTGVVTVINRRGNWLKEINPIEPVLLVFIPLFFLGFWVDFVIVIMNVMVLGIGVLTVMQGARKSHLGTLNMGMLTIAALIVCRFFDSDITFVMRGLLFVLVGMGFFLANYWMLKKRNTDEP